MCTTCNWRTYLVMLTAQFSNWISAKDEMKTKIALPFYILNINDRQLLNMSAASECLLKSLFLLDGNQLLKTYITKYTPTVFSYIKCTKVYLKTCTTWCRIITEGGFSNCIMFLSKSTLGWAVAQSTYRDYCLVISIIIAVFKITRGLVPKRQNWNREKWKYLNEMDICMEEGKSFWDF